MAWDRAVLGLISLAAEEGAPEIMVAEPQSHSVDDESTVLEYSGEKDGDASRD